MTEARSSAFTETIWW